MTPATLKALKILGELQGRDRNLVRACTFAEHMWPDGRRKGRNFAGGGMLSRLAKRGLVFWTSRGGWDENWGYGLTTEGRAALREAEATASPKEPRDGQ